MQHQSFASPINSCLSTPPEISGTVLEVAVALLTVTQNQRSPTLGQSPTSGKLASAEFSGSGWLLHASPCCHCCCPTSCKPRGFCLGTPPCLKGAQPPHSHHPGYVPVLGVFPPHCSPFSGHKDKYRRVGS